MFLQIPSEILSSSALPSSAKIIYGFLLSLKNSTDSICNLTSQQIADTVGLERTAVPRLVKVLEAEGLLKVHNGYSTKNRPQYSYEALVK